MTEAEKRLWSRLRSNRLGVHFRRQHRVGPYIVDFACLERKLIVEVDGGQHNERDGLAHDARRTDFLNRYGYSVLRFWNNDVLARTDDVVETIWYHLNPAKY
ncbi:MAG: endonuclease domain-containing protein [Alphaproteobacteria bacterium]